MREDRVSMLWIVAVALVLAALVIEVTSVLWTNGKRWLRPVRSLRRAAVVAAILERTWP
jgi:hypothetical protein